MRELLAEQGARPLHAVLRDQRVISGIGRSWVDEILWTAMLSPFKRGDDLDDDEAEVLRAAIVGCAWTGAIEHYERVVELPIPDKLPMPLQVHRHHGEPCPRCGATLEAVHYEDYVMSYCPQEQTGGRVLKDRRLSRLLVTVPLDALALALAAALLHAVWNLLTARSDASHATLAVAMVAGTVVCLPLALIDLDVDGSVWPYVVGSVIFELGYLTLLAMAYSRAPMSVVYPVARGGAPVIVLVVSVAALGATLAAGAAAGVLAVAAGVLLVRAGGGERDAARGATLGCGVAAFIAGYTMIDHAGLDHATPLAYLEFVLAPTALLHGRRRRLSGAPVVRAALVPVLDPRRRGDLRRLRPGPARARPAPAAPVAAVRESSVVIATALAAVVLDEPVDRRRWAGAVLVVAGIGAIALAG